MAEETAFQWLCNRLEACTSLDELEARGTVRIVLRNIGLDAASVGVEGISLLLERALAEELRLRGVEESDSLCERLRGELGRRFAGSATAPLASRGGG